MAILIIFSIDFKVENTNYDQFINSYKYSVVYNLGHTPHRTNNNNNKTIYVSHNNYKFNNRQCLKTIWYTYNIRVETISSYHVVIYV